MKRILFTTILVLVTLSIYSQEVKWLSFERAIELTKNNPKPILVDLYTDWCGWCKKMDVTTYKNKVIVKYINDNFYAVKLNAEGKDDITFKGKTFKYVERGRTKYHELAAAILNGKLSYPSTSFFNKQGNLIQTVPGFITEKKFETILAFFGKEAYKTTNWKNFEKNFKSLL